MAAGKNFSNCASIRKACDFLLSKQLASGGWGESYLSNQNKVNIGISKFMFDCFSCVDVFNIGVYQS